jgi:hypothetical protein
VNRRSSLFPLGLPRLNKGPAGGQGRLLLDDGFGLKVIICGYFFLESGVQCNLKRRTNRY